jgi:uncharacterized protein YdeI (YjbR/CyaY-like superfamily)
MIKTENFEKVEVISAAEWRAWLESHFDQTESIWLVTYKKHTGEKYIPHSDVLDEMLCFGWIDGIGRKLDEDRTMQLMSPRRTQVWAKTYKDRAARLIEEGRMHEAGLRSIEESKRLGLWDVMEDVDALINPADLVEALQTQPPAFEYFTGCAASYRRNVLRWIKSAKTKKTRAKRIQNTVELSAKREKIPHLS